MHGGDTPQTTSQEILAQVYFERKALNPRRKNECIPARIMGKLCTMYNLEPGFKHEMWDLWWESGVKYLRR